MAEPPKATLPLLKSTATFLMGTCNDGITYGGSIDTCNEQLVAGLYIADAYDLKIPASKQLSGASDATWGYAAGQSVASSAFFYKHAFIEGGLKCIPSVQLSTNSAEGWSQGDMQARGIWIANLLIEIGEKRVLPVRARVDNSVNVAQAHGTVLAKGSRHELRRIRFCEDNETDGIFDTQHADTKNMAVNAMGKWTPIKEYKLARSHLLNLDKQVNDN